MSEYHRLKGELESLKHKIHDARRQQNKKLIKNNFKWVKFLDILLIIAILSNVGAYLTTEYVITASNPNIPKVEANPVTAKAHDLPTSQEANKGFYSYVVRALLLLALASGLLYQRSFAVSEWGLWLYSIIVVFITINLFLDFARNTAILLGVLAW